MLPIYELTYPLSVYLVSLQHHLEFLVDLAVLGFGAGRELVVGLWFGTVGTHHSILMFLLVKCL